MPGDDVLDYSVDVSTVDDTDVVGGDDSVSLLSVDTPSSGAVTSSVLNYFDRVVDGLPDSYRYVAFPDDSSDSYSAILVYGADVDVSGSTVTFASPSTVSSYRVYSSSSGYGGYYTTYYSHDDLDSYTVTLPETSTTLYYSNAVKGYPVLGTGSARPSVSYSVWIVVAVFLACLMVVMNKLFFKYD